MKIGDRVIINLENPRLIEEYTMAESFYDKFNGKIGVIIDYADIDILDFEVKVKLDKSSSINCFYADELSMYKNSIRRV